VAGTENVPLDIVGLVWYKRAADYASLGGQEQDKHGNQPLRQERSPIDGKAYDANGAFVMCP
jgi:hypothetical protein